jgi:hypothetical protein
MKNATSLLMLLLCLTSSGQGINLAATDDLPGVQLVTTERYNPETLGRYAPDREALCTEYGFWQLTVADYSQEIDRVRLEIFVMEDAPSALGMLSVFADTCVLRGVFTAFSCTAPGRVAVAHGNLYINAFTLGRAGSSQQLCEQLVRKFMSANPQDSWFFPAIFRIPQFSEYTNTVKYSRGPLGLAACAPELTDLLDDIPFKCFSMDITAQAYQGVLARIDFTDLQLMNDFLAGAGLNLSGNSDPVPSAIGTYRSSYKINETKLIYLECTSPELRLADLIPENPDLNIYYRDH